MIDCLKMRLIKNVNNLEAKQATEAMLEKLFSNYQEDLADFIHTCGTVLIETGIPCPISAVIIISLDSKGVLVTLILNSTLLVIKLS